MNKLLCVLTMFILGCGVPKCKRALPGEVNIAIIPSTGTYYVVRCVLDGDPFAYEKNGELEWTDDFNLMKGFSDSCEAKKWYLKITR